nr:MAG TPA: hypothetical protein [Caudoviricetes sp.]
MISNSRLMKLLNREHSREKWQNRNTNGIWNSSNKRMHTKLLNRRLKEMVKAVNRIIILLQML